MTTEPLADRPLKLHWWHGKNFGDALNPFVVGYASGREVVASERHECDIFAVGSIMVRVQRVYKEPRDHRPAIWGTGMKGPHRNQFVPHVDFFAVRGPATAACLEIPPCAFGDPGLLLADLVSTKVERGDSIGIIPHHGDFRHPECVEKISALKSRSGIRLIDPRSHDPLAVSDQIRGCRHIFSASLHGLIVADSHNIPNTWVAGRAIHDTANFKFLDYFLSVGRPWKNPIDYDEIVSAEASLRNRDQVTYFEGIQASKVALLEAFPKHLKAPG